ncbi:helix-turn-helix transcriptional regulator [Legionella sp. D16C41]|uniref:helix-turn-helix transcriptional regulator n=1 Tax=Legionella sp. D16C41 TaxID=3402688 RepID=UPI003AF6E7FF
MASYTFLEKFLLNNRCIPELAQVYHHIYFKSIEGIYLASNNQMLSFLDLSPEEVSGRFKDSDIIKNAISLESVLANDRLILEKKSVQVFMELAITEKKQAQFLSIKAPLYRENEIIGLCGISIIVDNYNLSEFNDLISNIGNILENDLESETKLAQLNSTKTVKIKLTPREVQCLQLYMKGYSLKYIANILNLSHRTIEYYLENIKSKFGVKKRSELLPRAFNLYPELI